MSNIDKQWLQQKIADMEAACNEIPFGLDEDDSNTLAALRIALASLEADGDSEPVAFINGAWTLVYYRPPKELGLKIGDKLYTAPPAPVSVPDKLAGKSFNYIANKFQVSTSEAQWILVGWNACRAAMLQGAENAETPTTMQTAPSLDSSPKIAGSPSSNSPVIADGWVMVPVEPTEDMIVNGFESEPDESFSDEREWEAYDAMSGCQQAAHRAKLCWAAMIAAAPKPEVK